MWLLPAFVLLVGVVVLFDAMRRLARETELLVSRLAAVREVATDVGRIRAEARALAASVNRHR
jgi:cytochrome c-type biogenesis protein CcmH/NrfF